MMSGRIYMHDGPCRVLERSQPQHAPAKIYVILGLRTYGCILVFLSHIRRLHADGPGYETLNSEAEHMDPSSTDCTSPF